MYHLYITYARPNVEQFVRRLEQQGLDIVASTMTFRRRHGIVILAWNGTVDLGLLQFLNADLLDAIDFAVVPLPDAREHDPDEQILNLLYGPYLRQSQQSEEGEEGYKS
jgi:hypothetical protein